MQRCIEIAGLGAGRTAPNPMVGCVIVYRNKIIGEGYHVECGHAHAEVNAINSVRQTGLLLESTLYVNLEPCSHHGRTPPCSDLIVEKKIPHVVIGTSDPFAEVAGRGIEKLRKSGIIVETGVLANECLWLNRRFFTFHEKKRPYVILKWAQTLDGYIDMERKPGHPLRPNWISGELARRAVHKTRSQEAAILIGTRTAQLDNPSLTVRDWSGRSPLRLVIDREGKLSSRLNIFDNRAPTLVFTQKRPEKTGHLQYCELDHRKDITMQVLHELYARNIISLIVEGGSHTIQSFVESGMWDEAHVYTGPTMFFGGVKAPQVQGILMENITYDETILSIVLNPEMGYRL